MGAMVPLFFSGLQILCYALCTLATQHIQQPIPRPFFSHQLPHTAAGPTAWTQQQTGGTRRLERSHIHLYKSRPKEMWKNGESNLRVMNSRNEISNLNTFAVGDAKLRSERNAMTKWLDQLMANKATTATTSTTTSNKFKEQTP